MRIELISPFQVNGEQCPGKEVNQKSNFCWFDLSDLLLIKGVEEFTDSSSITRIAIGTEGKCLSNLSISLTSCSANDTPVYCT